MSSSFKEEYLDKVLNTKIGLIFIKRFKCFLNASNPCSGLSSRGLLSYFGVPTHASRTASDLVDLSNASLVMGLLYLSRDAPPISANSYIILVIFDSFK